MTKKMRNRTIASLTAALIAISAAGATQAEIITAGGLNAGYDGGALQLWLRADRGTTIGSGRVVHWDDQSTHNHDGTTANPSQGPELFTSDANFNGRASISFDTPGTADYFDLPSTGFLNGLQEMTIFTVSRSDIVGSQALFSRNHGAGGSTDDIMVEYNPGFGGINVRSDDGSAINVGAAANPAAASIAVSRLTAADLSIGVNGPLTNTVAGATSATLDNQAAKIGQRAGNTSLLFDGQIAEVIIYDRALTAEEINSVGYYLQRRYGIAGDFDTPVIYREIFPNGTNADEALAGEGWQINSNNGGLAGQQINSGSNGTPTNLEPVNSNPSTGGLAVGYAFNNNDNGTDYLFWTDEYTVDRSRWGIEEISWFQANESTSTVSRAAVEIDGQWYASLETFQNTVASFGGATGEEMVLDFRSAEWLLLNFVDGSALSLGGSAVLPGGDITAFGWYVDNKTGRLRLDSFTIRAVPVPTPAALPVGIAALGLLTLRRPSIRRR